MVKNLLKDRNYDVDDLMDREETFESLTQRHNRVIIEGKINLS